jgi:hypothetical protein
MLCSIQKDGRRSLPATIVGTVMAALVIAGAGNAAAQSADGGPGRKALVGSWLETATFPPEVGRPPLKSLVSFHDEGIMTYSDQGAVMLEPPIVFSSGRGVWQHLQKRTFAYTSFGLISDLNGNLVGYLKARGIYTMSESGSQYSGVTFAEVLDTDGNVLQSVEVTNAGQRIELELP